MKPSDFLTELSNTKLGLYKTAAGKDATAADKAGNFKRGNKRMSGITNATKKEFANDAAKAAADAEAKAKKVDEGYAMEDEQIDGMAQGEIREIIKNAVHIKNQLDKGVSLDGWMYSFVTVSNDKLNSVAEQINNPNIDEQGVAEGAPELLKKEMPTHRHAEKLLAQNGVSKDDPDYHHHLGNTIKHLRQFGNIDLINKSDKQGVAESQHSESCPHCGGEMVSEELMNEKKDACYYKVKSRYKVWPSAYASGALVKCRNKGASNWGNGGKKNESSILEGIERADESLHDWFNKEKWVRMDTKGKIKGPCAREPGEGKPKCLPQSKAHSLGKKGRASAAARKRREDPNPDRSGKAINVDTKKK